MVLRVSTASVHGETEERKGEKHDNHTHKGSMSSRRNYLPNFFILGGSDFDFPSNNLIGEIGVSDDLGRRNPGELGCGSKFSGPIITLSCLPCGSGVGMLSPGARTAQGYGCAAGNDQTVDS